ncbi:MAG: hypothetical protein AAF570_16330, partial [Bacteroidota bacterium]
QDALRQMVKRKADKNTISTAAAEHFGKFAGWVNDLIGMRYGKRKVPRDLKEQIHADKTAKKEWLVEKAMELLKK